MTKYVDLTKNNLCRAGDAILTFDKENELSRLSLPMMSLFSKKCSAFSPVKFMQTEEHECQIVIDKDTDCSQIPELNAINYVKGFRILKNPQDLDKVINGGFQDDYFVDNGEELIGEKEEFFIQPKAEVCINLDEDEKICVELALNEALSEPTKVRGFAIGNTYCYVI